MGGFGQDARLENHFHPKKKKKKKKWKGEAC